MLLSNEAELLAMEAEKYSGINPIVVDNNNLTIGLDSGFIDAVSSVSGAISAVSGIENKLDISAFTGYSAALDSGLSNAFETVHNDITELQGDDSYLSGSIDYLSGVVTTGLSAYSAGPNINITDYVISGKDWLDTIQEASAYAAQQNPTSSTEWNEAYETLTSNSGVWNSVTNIQEEVNYVSGAVDNKLDFSAFSDVSGTFLTAHQPISANEWNSSYETVQTNSASWASETFTGVDTDSTLTGNGKDTPLGVAEVQSLTSDNTINITSGNNEVILGVNGTWFNDAVNSAVTGAQGDAEVNTYVHNNSATINVVNTTVQSNSGNWNDTYNTYSNNSASYLTDASQFYPMNSNPSGYLTEETDWTNTIKEASANAYNEATALIPPAFDPTYISGAIDNKLDTTAFNIPESANWNDVYNTVQTNSGSWTGGGGGGGSIDTIPFIVQSPLTTGISGYSAYIGLDGEAFESSAYVPFSALTDNGMYDGYVHMINGSGLYADDAAHSNVAGYDDNGNYLADTTYYATEAYSTVQSNSANWGGGSSAPVSGLELSAGDYITIIDDIPNSASIISVTGLATTGDLNYVSGVVGDVESLLAQL